MEDKERQPTSVKLPQWCWWVLSGIIIVFLGYLCYVIYITESPNTVSQQGQLGDSFGLVNAFFAALAFWGVIVAMTLQRQELALQREELKNTQKVMKGQEEQLEAQNRTFQHQKFESSFFQLLGLYNSIIDTMEIPGRSGNGRRNSFSTMHQKLNMLTNTQNDPSWAQASRRLLDQLQTEVDGVSWEEDTKQIIVGEIDERGEEFLKNYQVYVGHYFHHLYNMFNFVDKEDSFLNPQEKNYYTNLIQAQLSGYELAVLFYYALNKQEKRFQAFDREICIAQKSGF